MPASEASAQSVSGRNISLQGRACGARSETTVGGSACPFVFYGPEAAQHTFSVRRKTILADLRDALRTLRPGRFLLIEDVDGAASNGSIGRALSRLVGEGRLRRCIRGVYFVPGPERLTMPPDRAALAIARKNRWQLVPTGRHALRRLGFDEAAIAAFTGCDAETVHVQNRASRSGDAVGVSSGPISGFAAGGTTGRDSRRQDLQRTNDFEGSGTGTRVNGRASKGAALPAATYLSSGPHKSYLVEGRRIVFKRHTGRLFEMDAKRATAVEALRTIGRGARSSEAFEALALRIGRSELLAISQDERVPFDWLKLVAARMVRDGDRTKLWRDRVIDLHLPERVGGGGGADAARTKEAA